MAAKYESSDEEVVKAAPSLTSEESDETGQGDSSPDVRSAEEDDGAGPMGIRSCRCSICGLVISATEAKFWAHVKFCKSRSKKKALKRKETMPRNRSRKRKGKQSR